MAEGFGRDLVRALARNTPAYDDSDSTTARTIRLIRDEARAEGYRQAITDLRDASAFWIYVQDVHPLGGDRDEFAEKANDVAADFLASRLSTEGSTDG